VASTLTGTDTAGYLDGPAASAQFTDPRGIALGADGSLYVAEYSRIRRISPSLAAATSLAYSGKDAGSGLANYDVRYRRAAFSGGFAALTYPASWQHTTARSVSLAAVKGSTTSPPRPQPLRHDHRSPGVNRPCSSPVVHVRTVSGQRAGVGHPLIGYLFHELRTGACARLGPGAPARRSHIGCPRLVVWRRNAAPLQAVARARLGHRGCSGIGRHVATRLLADGEQVVDVPPKLSARVRVFSTGQGRKTDATDAHSVALVGTRVRFKEDNGEDWKDCCRTG
jgi:hypothetical protein